MPTNTAISIVKGDNKTFRFTLQEYIDGTATAINLTGATITFTVKESYSDTSALIQLTSAQATEINVVDAGNGICDVLLVPANTNTLAAQDYLWDIQVEDSGGDIVTCNIGQFTIQADVT